MGSSKVIKSEKILEVLEAVTQRAVISTELHGKVSDKAFFFFLFG